MPLHDKVFENAPECNTRLNRLLIHNDANVQKNRDLRSKLICQHDLNYFKIKKEPADPVRGS